MHGRTLLNFLDIVRLPGLLEKGFGAAVEAQEGEPASARDRGDPVLSCSGRLWAEVNVGRAVGCWEEGLERRPGCREESCHRHQPTLRDFWRPRSPLCFQPHPRPGTRSTFIHPQKPESPTVSRTIYKTASISNQPKKPGCPIHRGILRRVGWKVPAGRLFPSKSPLDAPRPPITASPRKNSQKHQQNCLSSPRSTQTFSNQKYPPGN